MRLIKAQLLTDYMRERDMTGARLGRTAGVSRQFISQLVNGGRSSCSEARAHRIEHALDLLPGTLFRPDEDDERVEARSGRPRSSAAA